MKRHANSLLQRKLAEFDGSSERHYPQPDDRSTPVVEVKDGYDWLQLITQTDGQRASVH